MKSNGFNIEDINLKEDQKIELMMGILAMVYVIAVREGLLTHKLNPIPIKMYKNGKKYLSISIFRMGFAIIQAMFINTKNLIDYIGFQLKPAFIEADGSAKNCIKIKNV